MSKVLDRLDSVPVPTAPPRLTAADRCQGRALTMNATNQLVKGPCGAQAFIRAVFPDGASLEFCKHHGDALAVGLVGSGAVLHDQSGDINEKPSQSSV